MFNIFFFFRIAHPYSGRTLEIFSNQPCFSLYTGGRLPVPFFKHVQEPYPSKYEHFFKNESSYDREKCAASMLEDLMPILPNDGIYYDPKYQVADDELLKHGYFRGKNGCRYNHLGSFSVVPSWFPNGIKEVLWSFISSDGRNFCKAKSVRFFEY